MKENLDLWFTLAVSGCFRFSMFRVLPIKCIHFYVVAPGLWAQSHPLFFI